MTKTKAALILGLIAGICGMTFFQRQRTDALRAELAQAREENIRLASSLAESNANQHLDESRQQTIQELESEVARLRGAANKASRAEAEIAQLKSELKPRPTAGASPGGTTDSSASDGDFLHQYLGKPVEPPPGMDRAYTKEGLLSAVQLAAQNAGISLKKIEIDDSEFPFLIGIIGDQTHWEQLKEQFRKMDGYEYTGSVGNDTTHAFGLTPHRAYPEGTQQQINRRTTLRMQSLHDRLSSQP